MLSMLPCSKSFGGEKIDKFGESQYFNKFLPMVKTLSSVCDHLLYNKSYYQTLTNKKGFSKYFYIHINPGTSSQ